MSGFVRACALADLPVGSVRRVEIDSEPVALVHGDDGVFAIDDVCSHDEVSLSDGEVEGNTLECWLHGSRFDVRTGAALCLPAKQPVAVYDVEIQGDSIYISTSPSAAILESRIEQESIAR
jgi:3-phenylpropionate/trans-cinnamate dioxygenase ferredoxin component